MRLNRFGQIARDHRGSAVACWLDDETEVFQQPVNLANAADPKEPWHIVTRKAGVVTTYPNPHQWSLGANALAARAGQWVRQLEGASPRCVGSQSWIPVNGRVGDVDFDGSILVLSDDALTMWVNGKAFARTEVQGYTRLIHGLLSYTAGGQVKVYDTIADKALAVKQVGPGAAKVIAFRVNGSVWLAYQTDAHGGVVHPIGDASQGYRYGVPQQIYEPEIECEGESGVLHWSTDEGQFNQPSPLVIAEFGKGMMPLTAIVTPPAPDTFGPISAPLPEGTAFQMADFVFGASDFARSGSHDMVQVTRPEGRYLIKFQRGGAYELWATDASGNVHHLEDMSAIDQGISQHFTHTLWCLATMKVGRKFAYQSPLHQSVFVTVATKKELRREDFSREMWLLEGYNQFDCGPDMGVKRKITLVYDNTAGAHTPIDVTDPAKMRAIELFHFAEGAGWIGWEAHHSGRVYQTSTPVFNNYTRLARSMFYRAGGKPIAPIPTGLAAPMTPETPSMQIPSSVMATVRKFAAAFPLPQGDGSEGWLDTALRKPPNGWTRRLAEYVCFVHGPTWGHKRRFGSTTDPNDGAPLSAGTIAMREGAGMHCFDLLIGAGTGKPVLASGAESDFVTDQVFVPVTPVDHVGMIAPPIGRPPIAVPHWGITSFDQAPRLQRGDRAWYEQVIKATRLVGRYVVASMQSANGRIARTWAEGLIQTELLLQNLTADGLKGNFVMLCDTAQYGATRQQALDFVRQQASLYLKYPNAVAGLVLGNEVYHGVEASYMSDPSFWDEARALIDPRFPFAPGANDGGGNVLLSGGSFVVHHSDRALDPDSAGAIMKQAQDIAKRPVIDDEGRRIEQGGTGQSTGDIAFVQGLIAAVKKYGLGGSTLHVAAGRSCDVNALDPVQRQAIALYAAEVKPVSVPVPPPPVGHPLLDADMTDDAKWYPIVINRYSELWDLTVQWYRKANGRFPAQTDTVHGFFWRCSVERLRWKTMRAALENTWPGGAPTA